MIKQQKREKLQQYQNILSFQIQEKEMEKQQMSKKQSFGENMFARGKFTLLNTWLFNINWFQFDIIWIDEHEEELKKIRKQEELRNALNDQISQKKQYKAEQSKKQQEYDRKLDIAIDNMNRKVWEEDKNESQRERDKDILKVFRIRTT